MRVKPLAAPVEVEPPRSGEDAAECVACGTPDDAYIWVSERWRVRAMDRPTGLPMVLILECRSHLDLGDLTNLLAAELGVMTVRLERAIRSLDGVARVHVNRWGDGSAHLHLWFLARPHGRLQLRGTFLTLWDDILPVIPEQQWRENLALVAAWLADFGGQAIAEPPHIQWESPSTITYSPNATDDASPPSTVGPETSAPTESRATPNTEAPPYAPIPRQSPAAPISRPSLDTPLSGPGSREAGADARSGAAVAERKAVAPHPRTPDSTVRPAGDPGLRGPHPVRISEPATNAAATEPSAPTVAAGSGPVDGEAHPPATAREPQATT